MSLSFERATSYASDANCKRTIELSWSRERRFDNDSRSLRTDASSSNAVYREWNSLETYRIAEKNVQTEDEVLRDGKGLKDGTQKAVWIVFPIVVAEGQAVDEAAHHLVRKLSIHSKGVRPLNSLHNGVVAGLDGLPFPAFRLPQQFTEFGKTDR